MTPDFNVYMEGAKAIAGWLGSIVNWRHSQTVEKEAQITAALTSLMNAARETRLYLASIRHTPGHHDIAREAHLAQLWSKAGIDISFIDSDLATRYLMKADYWSDPQGWTEAEKDERLIQLDEVLRLGQEALLGS